MKWSNEEIRQLEPLLSHVEKDIEPLDGKNILVLCSAGGEIVFRLAKKMKSGHVIGAELDPALVEISRLSAEKMGLQNRVEFCHTDKTHLPFPDNTFDALVSEFIVYPTPSPTEMGQAEMARVLFPGGQMVITDVITVNPVPAEAREELRRIGLDYLCEATAEDFRQWMQQAGLENVKVEDLTPLVRPLWEERARIASEVQRGYVLLLEDSPIQLGKGLFYLSVYGAKPDG